MGAASDALHGRLLSGVERAAKQLTLEIAKELRRKDIGTPVDTGHARANWIPSIGQPYGSEVPGRDQGPYKAGVAEVMRYELAAGVVLYVSNSVPYIRRLNDGWSSMAPAMFVESAIDRAMLTVKTKTGIDFGRSKLRSAAGARGAENMASAYSPFADDD